MRIIQNIWSLLSGTVALALFCSAATTTPAQANLVLNPGFETGDFTNWTTTPRPSGGSSFGVDSASHSGDFAAYFNALYNTPDKNVGFDTISQTLSTTPGALYDMSFWLSDGFGNPPEEFRVFFGGTLVEDIGAEGFPYTQYTLTGLAGTGSSTVLEIQGYNQAAFHVDDISVTEAAVPEPGTWLASGLVAVVLAVRLFRRRACLS
jgi:hypothetical protein